MLSGRGCGRLPERLSGERWSQELRSQILICALTQYLIILYLALENKTVGNKTVFTEIIRKGRREMNIIH